MQKSEGGFTLHEILIVVAIIAILIGFAVPAIHTAKSSARKVQTQTTLRLFNTIASTTRDAGMTNAGNTGSDKAAALAFYESRGWLRLDKPPDLTGVGFSNGVWMELP